MDWLTELRQRRDAEAQQQAALIHAAESAYCDYANARFATFLTHIGFPPSDFTLTTYRVGRTSTYKHFMQVFNATLQVDAGNREFATVPIEFTANGIQYVYPSALDHIRHLNHNLLEAILVFTGNEWQRIECHKYAALELESLVHLLSKNGKLPLDTP